MAYEINDACISCGACTAECPTNFIRSSTSISNEMRRSKDECGACAGVCPVGAPEQA